MNSGAQATPNNSLERTGDAARIGAYDVRYSSPPESTCLAGCYIDPGMNAEGVREDLQKMKG